MIITPEDAAAEAVAELDAVMVGTTDDTPNRAIWHYGKAEGMAGILEHNKIWATHYGYTNDPKELRIGESAVRSVIDELAAKATGDVGIVYQALKARYRDDALTEVVDVYIACFTEDLDHPGDELSQWREYGDAGSGYSLGLRPAPVAVSTAAPPDSSLATYLVRVEYDIHAFANVVRTTLDRLIGVHLQQKKKATADVARTVAHMMRQVAALVPRLKSDFFRSEREWRYVVVPIVAPYAHYRKDVKFRTPPRRGLVPYVELPLAPPGEKLPIIGLIAGPGRRGPQRAAAASMLLAKWGYNHALAGKSRGALSD